MHERESPGENTKTADDSYGSVVQAAMEIISSDKQNLMRAMSFPNDCEMDVLRTKKVLLASHRPPVEYNSIRRAPPARPWIFLVVLFRMSDVNFGLLFATLCLSHFSTKGNDPNAKSQHIRGSTRHGREMRIIISTTECRNQHQLYCTFKQFAIRWLKEPYAKANVYDAVGTSP